MANYQDLMNKPEEWGSLRYDDPRLDAFAERIEDDLGLPPGVLVAIKNAGERTPTTNGRWDSSPKGAQGIMQFMPDTMNLQNGAFRHDPNNPFESIIAAGKLVQHTIKYQYKDDLSKVFADYNGGPDAVKALESGTMGTRNARGDIIFRETQGYLARISEYLTTTYRPRLSQRMQERQQRREATDE